MLNERNLLQWLSDVSFLKIAYKLCFGEKLNLKNPKTFNEKLQWLKLYDRRPEYTIMVDKIAVKRYVTDRIGSEYVIPTLGVWKRPEDIEWDKLPNQFVLKWNHDSGSIVICKDKDNFDREKAIKKLRYGEKVNGFWYGREWPYKDVKPQILAEKYMEDESGELKDYKFFCFNGHVRCFKVDFDRFTNHHANYFDINGNFLPFGETICPPDSSKVLALPNNISKMIQLAEALSESIPFVRVDFYSVNDNIYFGEITFYPAGGFGPFVPNEWDYTFGSWLKLPI